MADVAVTPKSVQKTMHEKQRRENTDEWEKDNEKENRRHLQNTVLCRLVAKKNVPKPPSRDYPQKNTKTQQERLATFVQTVPKIRNSLNFIMKCYFCAHFGLLVRIFRNMMTYDLIDFNFSSDSINNMYSR